MITKKNKISLTGMMGSGKSSIGKILAKKFGLPFYDSDKEVEKKFNLKVNEIFIRYGENRFRVEEELVCKKILQNKSFILALGGGSILNDSVRNIIKENCLSIYLRTSENILLERLKDDKSRPLLIEKDIKKVIKDLITERENYYIKSDIIIDNNNNSLETIADEIITLLNNYKI